MSGSTLPPPPPPPPSVMANEKGGTLTTPCRLAQHFQLILTSTDSHPIMQNLQKLELGKLIFTLATTATLGVVFSPKFPDVPLHYIAVVGFLIGCAVIWNGILFEKVSLQLLGITLILCLLCVLVASFLPIAFSWACCLPAALFLTPFIYVLMKPQAAAGGDDA